MVLGFVRHHKVPVPVPKLFAIVLVLLRLEKEIQAIGCPHACPALQNRMKVGVGKPGLIPQKDKVRFDSQALLHHHLYVIDNPIESAVGQNDALDSIQQPAPFVLKQFVLDVGDPHSPIHGVFVQRVCVQVCRQGTRHHHPIMMRLVAIPVQDANIAWAQHCLQNDLIRSRCPVRHEVSCMCPIRFCCLFLGKLQRPGGVQE
mmetsp:Transcript_116453/g.202551  ORF Transcript_116453/g.202551 Transcript_116453/m.202551 type:complete len:202 (+) Transcript_116453:3375-3980(+)